MKMIGTKTHEAVQECSYGCCIRRGYKSAQGRKQMKRAVKRIEKRAVRREVAEATA
jgi:hypothetical protein